MVAIYPLCSCPGTTQKDSGAQNESKQKAKLKAKLKEIRFGHWHSLGSTIALAIHQKGATEIAKQLSLVNYTVSGSF